MTDAPALRRSSPDVPTPDGAADSYFVQPDDDATHPAVLLYMDGIGLRPRIEEMADRIASAGYAVLAPNVFYRAGRAPIIPDVAERLKTEDRATVFADIGPLIRGMTPAMAASDAKAFLDFLDAQPGVASGPIATTGYCMGGALSLRAAIAFPDRVAAAASFHGGNLAPEADPNAVHLGVGSITAEVYVGHADNDASAPPEQQERLAQALSAAGVTATTELYEGASHGFTMSDMAVYDAGAEQRHWDALLSLLARRLPTGV